jgi:hypothetical protein
MGKKTVGSRRMPTTSDSQLVTNAVLGQKIDNLSEKIEQLLNKTTQHDARIVALELAVAKISERMSIGNALQVGISVLLSAIAGAIAYFLSK